MNKCILCILSPDHIFALIYIATYSYVVFAAVAM